MKRIITFLLCIALAVSMLALVSCEGGNTASTLDGKTPEELYEASQQKLKEADAFYVSATQTIVMSAGGESMDFVQLVESKISGDDLYMKTSNDLDPSIAMEVTYVDGVMYGEIGGSKVKGTFDKEAFMNQYIKEDPSESTLLDIPESWFENIKFEKEGNGWALKFVVSGDKYTEVYANLGVEGATIVGDVDFRIYFDNDGNLEKLVASIDMEVLGVSAHCDSVSLITIGDVEITAPEDADTYREVNFG